MNGGGNGTRHDRDRRPRVGRTLELVGPPLLSRPPLTLVADVVGFDSANDAAYLEKLHIPLLRQAGDFQTAALLAPPSPLMLHNLGTHFLSEPFEHAFKVQGAPKKLCVSSQELSALEIAAWLTKAWP